MLPATTNGVKRPRGSLTCVGVGIHPKQITLEGVEAVMRAQKLFYAAAEDLSMYRADRSGSVCPENSD
jgi:hypothetical protein